MTSLVLVKAPSWITSGAYITGGLDLLGLRLPVQSIGGSLLDGITTVTPSVRYLSFRAWLIHRYGQTGQPDSLQSFTNFAARIESALVLANLAQDRSIGGLIGTEEALARLDANSQTIEISSLVKTPAVTIYAGPSDQLSISKSRDLNVPGLVMERGVPLALSLDQRLGKNTVIDRLLSQHNLAEVSPDDLRELGSITRIDQIPDDERELIIAAIIPAKPMTKERARIGTYASILALASKLKARPTENDLFDSACSMNRFGEPALDQVADGWTGYCVRDSIAVTQEAVMAAIMDEITVSSDKGIKGANQSYIIAGLMERIEEHNSALYDLDLLKAGESASTISFRDLQLRINDRITADSIKSHGITRWPHSLSEPKIYRQALKSGAGALTLAVVAWLLAERRIGDAVRENSKEYSNLSYQGWRRMGLRDVILPELERFHHENRSLRDVAAELALRTVQQHLQIVWSRLQVDLRRDVALLTTENNKWFSRNKSFSGGRTASRLQQTIGWLIQLKLIDDDGITSDGNVVLARALNVLSERGSA